MSSYWSDFRNAFWPSNDVPQRVIVALLVVVLPGAGGWIAHEVSLTLANAIAVLSPLAIIAAGQLTSFVFLANLRMKISEHASGRQHSEAPDRSMIDTAVAGVLAGAVVSAVSALGIAILAMVTTGADGSLKGPAAVIILATTVFAFGIFTANVPNLWAAYSQAVTAESRRPRNGHTHL